MSDPKSSYGEPVEEPTPEGDVVGRAHEGLAEAEAARRDSVADERIADPAPAEVTDAPTAEPAAAPAEPDPWQSPEAAELQYEPAAAPASDATAVYETPAYEPVAPVVTSSEPVAEHREPAAETVAVSPVSPQPIFVQAPEAPRPRGNRGAAAAIGLLAALAFAVLYLAVWLAVGAASGEVTLDNVGTVALDALASWSLWVPVVVFFLAFWLLGAIINRGRWGSWVIFGLLVGLASYGGYLLGQLFQEQFWAMTASQGAELMGEHLLAPLAIASFIIGRELTIWFGAWVAARGRRVTELNIEAQREYERTLEAGPQLVRQ
jgi:hypothetical protein